MSTLPIAKIRRMAAECVLSDLHNAVDKIQEQEELRAELEHIREKINESLEGLSRSLRQTRENAALINRGILDTTIAAPLSWAEKNLTELKQLIDQARGVARIALEVDRYKLLERKERLCTKGSNALKLRPKPPKNQWDTLKDLKTIWDEGLDFMSGLCLRHEGLDNRLCQIADAIIAEIRWTGVKAITVPGRGGPGMVAQIVHLRFPEWTIWALPLTAHELWHLGLRGADMSSTDESSEILEAILEQWDELDSSEEGKIRESAQHVWGSPDLQRCLADVFGTFVMGPAYAFAAIWLVLDPTNDDHEQRALAILKTLEAEPDYSKVHMQLKAQWREAAPTAGTLKYVGWINAQLKFLKATASAFRIERWKEIRGPWVDSLSSGEVDGIEARDLEIRYALNAAWKARVESPEKQETIASKCRELCERMITKKMKAKTPPADWLSM